MIDILKVVNRAVGKSGAFSNVCIDDGVVEANNGRISIVADVPALSGISAIVPAGKFFSAIRACRSEPEVKATEANLIVKAGSFSARIPLIGGDFPRMGYGEGSAITAPTGMVEKLAIAQSFAISAAFNGVLLRGSHLYGISESGAVAIDCMVQMGHDVVIPIDTVTDIVNIREQPTAIRVSDNYAVIEYASFKLRTALVDKKWPDAEAHLSFDTSLMVAISDELRGAVDSVLPFTDRTKLVEFTGDSVTGGEAEVAGIAMPKSAFNGEYLLNAMKYATDICVTSENIAQLVGSNMRAVIAGSRRKQA